MEGWLKKYRRAKKKAEREEYHAIIMDEHRKNIIIDYKMERDKLKNRIKIIEQELHGMGERDYELKKDKEI